MILIKLVLGMAAFGVVYFALRAIVIWSVNIDNWLDYEEDL